jgi:hypothetical protein
MVTFAEATEDLFVQQQLLLCYFMVFLLFGHRLEQ